MLVKAISWSQSIEVFREERQDGNNDVILQVWAPEHLEEPAVRFVWACALDRHKEMDLSTIVKPPPKRL